MITSPIKFGNPIPMNLLSKVKSLKPQLKLNGYLLHRNLATTKEFSISPSTLSSKASIPQYLKFNSGEIFEGISFGAEKEIDGEVVFTTSTTGYPESMTDPSFQGQILVFTQPLIGNYGVPANSKDKFGLLKYFESDKIQVSGIVVNDYAYQYSHWNAVESLAEWCQRYDVPAITNIDTRQVVKLLTQQGSSLASLTFDKNSKTKAEDPNSRNLVDEVSTKSAYTLGEGDIHIAVVDCGIKHNILRALLHQNMKVTVLPWNTNLFDIIYQFDGLFISNGPGNPKHCTKLVSNLNKIINHWNKPIFGICMGNQILGQSIGLNTYKMRFGNRGHNQPAISQLDGRCFITSQNHGYALEDDNLPKNWTKYFINANDGSNEGIRHAYLPFSSVQFHPEAKGGPKDTMFLFENFANQCRKFKFMEDTQIVQKESAYA